VDRESEVSVPTGTDDPASLPARQHAWNDYAARDDAGNVLPPRHHVLLHLDYDGSEPTADDRRTLEDALRSLERAYEWSNEGLLFTLGYSPAYFESLGGSPADVDLPEPRALSELEDPEFDTPDAILHFASDHAQVVLAAEEGMRGNREALNDGPVDATLTDAFSVADRRTGFVGEGLPADNQDTGGVPTRNRSTRTPRCTWGSNPTSRRARRPRTASRFSPVRSRAAPPSTSPTST